MIFITGIVVGLITYAIGALLERQQRARRAAYWAEREEIYRRTGQWPPHRPH